VKDLVVVLIGQHEGPRIALALSNQEHAENTQKRIFEKSSKGDEHVITIALKLESTFDLLVIKFISQSD
jgi:hypothetical protein